MKIWMSIPALALILLNLGLHALGGVSSVPVPEISSLARMGAHHYAQMTILLLLLLMARQLRDHLWPALAAALALAAAAALDRFPPDRLEITGFELIAIPLLWGLTALTAASAAAGAVPPPEERPGLTKFKKAVLAINLINCGLLLLFRHTWPGPGLSPGFLSTALFTIFSVWLLVAAGRWANLAFIAGLAAAAPPLTALLVLTGRPPWPLEVFASAYDFCAGFQTALLSLLSALTCLIALAVKAGIRLAGRGRQPVRPLARSLMLFPAVALVMAALLWPVRVPDREDAPAPFTGEMKTLRLADLIMRAPATWGLGPIHYRLPLAGQADRLILAERIWTSEADLEHELKNLKQRLSNTSAAPDAELSGERTRLFFRPAWLFAASTPEKPAEGAALSGPRPFRRLELELYLLYPGGGLKLAAAFDHETGAGRGLDYETFARQSTEQFMETAVDLIGRYRWLGPGGRAGPVAFRTVFGAFDRPVEGLLMTASASDRSETAGGLPIFSSRDDWSLRPGEARSGRLSAPDPAEDGRVGAASSTGLTIRWGGPGGKAGESFRRNLAGPLGDGRPLRSLEPPSGRISAFPLLDRGLYYYQGCRLRPNRPLTLAGRPGRLEMRYFHQPPLRPAAEPQAGLRLTWTADGPAGPDLKINFSATLRARDPADRAGQLSAALGQWQAVADTVNLTARRTEIPSP